MKKTDERVHLFWVITPDHKEDWFTFACNKQSAERFHEEYEGYARGDATATAIIADVLLDEFSPRVLPRHAQLDDMKLLGFEIIDALQKRVVRLDNLLFIEGGLQSLIKALPPPLSLAQGHKDSACDTLSTLQYSAAEFVRQ